MGTGSHLPRRVMSRFCWMVEHIAFLFLKEENDFFKRFKTLLAKNNNRKCLYLSCRLN